MSRKTKTTGRAANDVRHHPQAEPTSRHPEPWLRDLNPNALAGQNIGPQNIGPESDRPEEHGIRASDLKEARARLPELSADELAELRILPVGSRLEEGAVYLDLLDRSRGEFKAEGSMHAAQGEWLVAKRDVDHELWNRLRGKLIPQATGGRTGTTG